MIPRLVDLTATAILTALAGCGPCADDDPSPEAPCTTPTCRQQRIVDQREQDAGAAFRAIDALEGEVEQIAALEALFLARGDAVAAGAACGALETEAVRERCLELRGRRHLWAAKGGSSRPSPAAAAAPEDLSCRPDEPRKSCVIRRATELAPQAPERVPPLCESLQQDTWRDECFFRAAEAAYDGAAGDSQAESATDPYRTAASLCRDAGRFRDGCVVHLSGFVARHAPSLHAEDAPRWQPFLDRADAMSTFWRQEDAPLMGSLAREQFYARALREAASRSTTVSSEVLEQLPDPLAPYLHQAVAWRMACLSPTAHDTLSGFVEDLSRALSGGPLLSDSPDRNPPCHPRPVPMFDGQRQGLSPQWRLITYMGTNEMRLVSPDRAEDLTICALEALRRFHPRPRPLLEQAQEHSGDRARATARRLLAGLGGATPNAPGPEPQGTGPAEEGP